MDANATNQGALSERELEILKLVCTGASNQQIARDLFISVNTVKVHLRNIFGKLGVESRTEATLYAIRQGWFAPGAAPTAAGGEEQALPRERIAAWQRVFFVLAATAVALAVFLPPTRMASNGAFTDRSSGAQENPPGPTTSRWSGKAQMPTARARLAVVACSGKIYAIGGDTDEGVSGVLEVYDPDTDSWARLATKPQPVRNIGAVELNGRIYVPGGHDALDQASTALEIYDPAADSWSVGAPLPAPLFAYAIAAVHGKLYLFGGSDGVRYLDTVHVYDPVSATWSTGTPMSAARGFCAAAVLADRVYVLGGYDGQAEAALCEVYDPAKEGSAESPWSRRSALQSGRGGLAAVSAEGYVYAIGGGWTQSMSFNERYDAGADQWVTFDSPLLGQWRTLGAAAVSTSDGTVIYAVGGWGDRNLSTNYSYRTFFRIYMPSM